MHENGSALWISITVVVLRHGNSLLPRPQTRSSVDAVPRVLPDRFPAIDTNGSILEHCHFGVSIAGHVSPDRTTC